MKNCLMTTISAGLWLEPLEMHCKSFQCKYFIKCKTPDWIFLAVPIEKHLFCHLARGFYLKLFRINNFSGRFSIRTLTGGASFQLKYKSFFNVILIFLIDTNLSRLSPNCSS